MIQLKTLGISLASVLLAGCVAVVNRTYNVNVRADDHFDIRPDVGEIRVSAVSVDSEETPAVQPENPDTPVPAKPSMDYPDYRAGPGVGSGGGGGWTR